MQEISQRIGMERHTLSKYLTLLFEKGKIEMKKVGNLKLWYPITRDANINAISVSSEIKDEILLAKQLSLEIKFKVGKPKLIIVFSSTHIDVQKFLDNFCLKFDESTKIVGCTTVGEFSNNSLSDNSVVCLAIDSENIEVGVGIGKEISKNGELAGQNSANKAVGDLKISNEFLLQNKQQTDAQKYTKASKSLALIFPDGMSGSEESVVSGVMDALSSGTPIFGGSCGDNLNQKKTLQFVGNNVFSDSVLTVLLVSNAKFSFISNHGWIPSSNGVFVTKSSKRIVYELNHERASKVYADLLNIDEKSLLQDTNIAFGIGNRNPFGAPDITGELWLKHPKSVNSDGSITFFSDVPQGVALSLTTGKNKELLNATEDSLNYINDDLEDLSCALVFNCVARKEFLKNDSLKQEFDLIKQKLNCPFIGFFTMGEQSKTRSGMVGHRNQTINIVALSKNKA